MATLVDYLSNTDCTNIETVVGDEIIPTVDYLMLFSEKANQRSNALDHLSHACQHYGFFYVRVLHAHIIFMIIRVYSYTFMYTASESRYP